MDTKEFHLSTGKELLAIQHRVRNLIDHWGEDGRYKEAILKTVIQRFLPETYVIATGFVVRQTATRGNHESSNQIDLLIYDKSYPVLFKESDFVIVTPDSVLGIIEVKANLENQGLFEIVQKANNNGKFIYEGKIIKEKPFFNGIFSFEGFEASRTSTLQNHITNATNAINNVIDYEKFKVNHISFNKDLFYKYWGNHPELSQYYDVEKDFLYKIEDLSFSFFISNLIDNLNRFTVIMNSNLWFPVDKSINVLSKF